MIHLLAGLSESARREGPLTVLRLCFGMSSFVARDRCETQTDERRPTTANFIGPQALSKTGMNPFRNFSLNKFLDRLLAWWLEAIAPDLWRKIYKQ